jgi:hypothetical protein
MELIDGSETSAFKNQTPGIHPKDYSKFPRSMYFYKLLYMFQAVPPRIIRSTKLYIQPAAAAGSSIGLKITDDVCTVLCS